MGSGITNQKIVAIDGPAGAGKSSVSRKVAEELGFVYLDTGAMYRAVTLACLQSGLAGDPLDPKLIEDELGSLDLIVRPDGGLRLNGSAVDGELRSKAVTDRVSAISALPVVRHELVRMQRQFAKTMIEEFAVPGIVVDGRDIGSHVFPNAKYRFYLDATLEERSRRRAAQAPGFELSLEQWKQRLAARDRWDSERPLAPLTIPEGALVIDTTHLSKEQVVQKIVEIVRS